MATTAEIIAKMKTLSGALGVDDRVIAGVETDAELDARINKLEAQWARDFTSILSASALIKSHLDGFITTHYADVVPPENAGLQSVYRGSHLPLNYPYGKGGLNRQTGKWLSGWQHVSQSIYVILSTPLGSRVMRRNFGSRIFDLIDRPMTVENVIEVYLATAEALERWEPRFQLRNARILEANQSGRFALAVYGAYYARGHLGDFTEYEEPDGVLVTLRQG